MKKTFFLTCILASTMIFTACKKEKETAVVKPELEAKTQTEVDDNNQLKAEDDALTSEIRDAVDNIEGIAGARIAVDTVWCGLTTDLSNIQQKEVTFTFDNTTLCNSPRRIRGGKIKVKLIKGDKWKDAGSILGITFENFTIKRFEPTRTWTFNGYKTLENVNGTRLANWTSFSNGQATLAFRERAKDINVSYLPASATTPFQMKYSVARLVTWSRKVKAGGLKTFFTIDGDTAFGGMNKVDSWGTNRNGTVFTNDFQSPWVSDNLCGFGQPNSGEFVHKTGGNTLRIILGVTAEGALSTATCAYGYKVIWTTAGGVQGEKVVIY
jgi:hypothetical protein